MRERKETRQRAIYRDVERHEQPESVQRKRRETHKIDKVEREREKKK